MPEACRPAAPPSTAHTRGDAPSDLRGAIGGLLVDDALPAGDEPGAMAVGGPLLMVGSAGAWAAGLILTKVALDETGAAPNLVLVVQLSASVGVLGVIGLVAGAPTGGAWRRGWVGLLEPGVAYQLALAGLAATSAANASVLGSIEPAVVPLIAWVLLRERPHRRTVVVAAATAGAVLVSFAGDGGGGSPIGDGLVVASVVVAALYVVVASRYVASVPPLPAAFTQQAWALGFVVAGGVAVSGSALWPDLTTRGLVLVALSGVVGYALPFWPYLAALRRLPVARAAAYLTLIPVCGLAGSVGFLRDQITWLDLVGAGLVVGPLLSDAVVGRAARIAVPRPSGGTAAGPRGAPESAPPPRAGTGAPAGARGVRLSPTGSSGWTTAAASRSARADHPLRSAGSTPSMTISTRRLRALAAGSSEPSGRTSAATGCVSPTPRAVMRSRSTPPATRWSTTASARRWERFRLYPAVPLPSVCPVTRTGASAK
jgi:drug/metabolite transporter (DMT)-like permease